MIQCLFLVAALVASVGLGNESCSKHNAVLREPRAMDSHSMLFSIDLPFECDLCTTEWMFGFNDSIRGWQESTLDEDKHSMVALSSLLHGREITHQKQQPLLLNNLETGRCDAELVVPDLAVRDSGLYWFEIENPPHSQVVGEFLLKVNATEVAVSSFVKDAALNKTVDHDYLQYGDEYAVVCSGEDSPKLPQLTITSNISNFTNARQNDGTFNRSKISWFKAAEPVYFLNCTAARESCTGQDFCQQSSSLRILVSDIENASDNGGIGLKSNNRTLQENETVIHSGDEFTFSCQIQRYLFDGNVTMQAELSNGTIIYPNELLQSSSRFSRTFTWQLGALSVAHAGVYACLSNQSVDRAESTVGSPTVIVVTEVRRELHLHVLPAPTAQTSSSLKHLLLILPIAAFVLCTVLIGAIIYEIRTKGSPEKPVTDVNEEGDIDVTRLLLEAAGQNLFKSYHIQAERLKIGQKVGSGNFSVVHEGWISYVEDSLAVAVKTAHDSHDQIQCKSLTDEMKIMAEIGYHVNVLGLVGVVCEPERLLLVVEYCAMGSLHDYIRERSSAFLDELDNDVPMNHYVKPWKQSTSSYKSEVDENWSKLNDFKTSNILTTSELLSYCFQIANGMTYLSEKKILHRDLATRNLLLTSNFIVKIADFGQAKPNVLYIPANETPMAVRWQAPECFSDSIFTIKSDVWSFGVVMWELFSLGKLPYDQLTVRESNQMASYLAEGNRLNKPKRSPDEMFEILQKEMQQDSGGLGQGYRLMRRCWQDSPDKRPSFSECLQHLETELARCSEPMLNDTKEKLNEQKSFARTYETMRRSHCGKTPYYNINAHSKIKQIERNGPMTKARCDSVELISL